MSKKIIKGKLFFYCKTLEKINKNYLNKLSLLIILIGIFLLPLATNASSITPEKIIELTNVERQKAEEYPLTANQLLTQAAYEKGKAIIKNNIFQHNLEGKKFSEWIRETGYKYSYVGENLAIDFLTSEGVIKAWLNSSLHKKNLLNPSYQEIGVAVLEDKFQNEDTILIVQIFGTPPEKKVQPIIAGISNNNTLIENQNLFLNIEEEKMLTHSLYNNFKINQSEENLSSYKINYYNDNNSLNNFFEQQFIFYNFFLLTLFILIFFIYYIYFIKIIKHNLKLF